MSITKVNGTIEEQRGVNGRIKVISFKKDGVYINNPLEIRKEFPPDGFVFAPHFFSHFEYKLNTLVEFPFSNFKSTKDNGDIYLLDFKSECNEIGYPVFTILENILFGEFSINPTILNNYLESFESTHFYIAFKEWVYGPFKSSKNEILPKTGKEVCRWETSELSIYNSGDKAYFLTPPLKNSDLIDCMTSAQLNSWLKDQIKNLNLEIDFTKLAKALESQQYKDLDIERMKRVLGSIDQVSLSQTELKFLADSSEKLRTIYSASLLKLEDELKRELIEPVKQRRIQIESEILILKKSIDRAQKEEDDYQSKIQILKNEIDTIIKEKDRLIDDIRIHATVDVYKSTEKKKLLTYDEQVYKGNGDPYVDLNEFIQTYNKAIDNNEDGKSKFGYNSILQLKEYKCLLSNNIESILKIARLSNNCKVLIQQVEPDWLKFEYLFENGLKQIWEAANSNPTIIHFLILEDINMASIECYGKPLLDIIDGIRLKLPGHNSSLPGNLWIWGVPLSDKHGLELGLPLIATTFKKWGGIPKEQNNMQFQNIESNKVLILEKLFDHSMIVPNSINEYFPEL